jgi:hypothetical protein
MAEVDSRRLRRAGSRIAGGGFGWFLGLASIRSPYCSSALPSRPRRAFDRMICGGQLYVCLRSNLFRKPRTVLNQQPLDSHFRGILEPRPSLLPEIQDSCHAQSRNDDLTSLPVSLRAFRCPCRTWGNMATIRERNGSSDEFACVSMSSPIRKFTTCAARVLAA